MTWYRKFQAQEMAPKLLVTVLPTARFTWGLSSLFPPYVWYIDLPKAKGKALVEAFKKYLSRVKCSEDAITNIP